MTVAKSGVEKNKQKIKTELTPHPRPLPACGEGCRRRGGDTKNLMLVTADTHHIALAYAQLPGATRNREHAVFR